MNYIFYRETKLCGCIAHTFPNYTHSPVFLVEVVWKSCKSLEIEGSGLCWVCGIFEIHDNCEGSRNYMQALRLQEVEPPRFPDNPQKNVLMLSVLSTSCLYPQVVLLVLISVTVWADHTAIMRPEGLSQWKIPMSPSGIEPVAFRLVAQCLKQLRHRFFGLYKYHCFNFSFNLISRIWIFNKPT